MGPATLAGVRGTGEVISRPRPSGTREYRGIFFFRAEDAPALTELEALRGRTEFEGPVDGQNRRLQAVVSSVLLGAGMAFFDGSGEPYSCGEEATGTGGLP